MDTKELDWTLVDV